MDEHINEVLAIANLPSQTRKDTISVIWTPEERERRHQERVQEVEVIKDKIAFILKVILSGVSIAVAYATFVIFALCF